MDVKVLKSEGLGEDDMLSIRCGNARRQAPALGGKQFRFPSEPADGQPLKVEIMKTTGSSYVVLKPNETQYKVIIETKDGAEATCELLVAPSAEAAGSVVETDCAEAQGDGSAGKAREAKDYLEQHKVLPFLQALLHSMLKEKPQDPFAYIAKHITGGYKADEAKAQVPVENPTDEAKPLSTKEKQIPDSRVSTKAPATESRMSTKQGSTPSPPSTAALPESPVSTPIAESPRSAGPVDISALTKVARDDNGMLEQPAQPKFKGALVEIFVRGQPYGGSDKSSNGHCYDSTAIANGMISAGMSCQLIHYIHEEHDSFFELCKNFDFIILRCNADQIKADGGSQDKFDDCMREMKKLKIQVWPSVDEDALCKVAKLCLPAICNDDTPNACYADVPAEDLAEAKRYAGLMGAKALSILCDADTAAFPSSGPVDISSLTRVARDDLGMLEQPAQPKYKGAFVEIFVRGQAYGGSDKSSNGHRYDSIALSNGLISAGMSCQLIHYIHEEHDKFFEVCKNFDFIICGCTPDQVTADGGIQEKFDESMRELQKLNIQVLSSLDEEELCKVAKLCLPAFCKEDTPNACYADIPARDLTEASRYGCMWGTKALAILSA